MKLFSTFGWFNLLLVLGGAVASGATTTVIPPPSGPRIQFSETNFHFGTVPPTDILQHDFMVTNVGDTLLLITNVQPGCGCTTAGEWDRQVQPGKTGRIPIQFNPASFNGTVTKAIMVFCNGSVQAMYTLHIQANVLRPFEVKPSFIHFLPVENEAAGEEKVVRIVNNLEEWVSLETPVCTNPVFKAELRTLRPGREFELHVAYERSATNAQGVIRIHTSSTNQPVISLNVALRLQPPVSVMPEVIRLAGEPSHLLPWYAITVRNNSRNPLHLSDATINVEQAKIDLHETDAGKSFTLSIGLPPDFRFPADHPVAVTVKTTNPEHPILTIPVLQMPLSDTTAHAASVRDGEGVR